MLERSHDRDQVLAALLPLANQHGWTRAALIRAAGPDADLLFPGGATEMVEAYIDLADRWMLEDAALLGMEAMRVSARVRTLVALRLRRNHPYKDAVRRAVAVLLRPGGLPASARSLARTVDAIWTGAGDRSSDLSWYTKRATLAAVYNATLLFWLSDTSDGDEATLAFLERRLAGVAAIGRVRARLRSGLGPVAGG